jgi:hypothetical protein
MFEDIEDTLRNGKRRPSGSENDGEANNNRNRRDNSGRRPSEEDIARVIRENFGGNVHAVPGGIVMERGGDAHKEIFDKLEGMVKSLSYMAEQLGVKPNCLDATNTELSAGDVLKCPGGELKTVLKVGWKFAILSHTDDQTKVDGPWFEDEINLLNFIKKV